jgi:phosphatidylinositol 4-phosphatase
MNVASYV